MPTGPREIFVKYVIVSYNLGRVFTKVNCVSKSIQYLTKTVVAIMYDEYCVTRRYASMQYGHPNTFVETSRNARAAPLKLFIPGKLNVRVL